MRFQPFIEYMRDEFQLLTDPELAHTIAMAISVAEIDHVATFEGDGVTYAVCANWYDGCISGDCNPATCYTNWTLLRRD